MPVGTIPRYKVIKCRTCGKVIHRFDRSKYSGYHVPMEDIMSKTRQHYKEHHPKKFKESVERGVLKRMSVKNLNCPICGNPVLVEKANIFLKCPKCGTSLRSVKVRK